MSLYPTKSYPIAKGPSEFEILKASHRFLREDSDIANDASAPTPTTSTGVIQTWEEKLAEKYYESLYREFALCDLKHYKSGNFALRWRTEDEVIAGTGETTCGNTRCRYHHHLHPQQPELNLNLRHKKQKGEREKKKGLEELATLELPFAYVEHGEAKNALVKVVLCPKCVRKLMWKRRKDRERVMAGNIAEGSGNVEYEDERGGDNKLSGSEGSNDEDDSEIVGEKGKGKETISRADDGGRELETRSASRHEERERSRRRDYDEHSTDWASKRRSSRSRSPRRHNHHGRRSHSPSRKHSRRDT